MPGYARASSGTPRAAARPHWPITTSSFLTDYFQRGGIIPKFYFIVDRIDLLIQAQRRIFRRGPDVHTIDSREAFARDIKATQALHNTSRQAGNHRGQYPEVRG